MGKPSDQSIRTPAPTQAASRRRTVQSMRLGCVDALDVGTPTKGSPPQQIRQGTIEVPKHQGRDPSARRPHKHRYRLAQAYA